jgi:geranylgeranyl diphosphate synthase, type II
MYINISEAFDVIDQFHKDNNELKYPQRLYAPRNYIMSMEGKKMRSLLCLLGYGLYKDDYHKALPLAYILELFHNFTLVHDDIMDDASLRRGVPTVHVKYDSSSAILTGDVMLIEVYDRLCKLNLDDLSSYMSLFNTMAREVCEGQSMDMDFENREDVSIEEYLKMIELKTSVLIGLSLRFGSKYAGASAEDEYHLYQFGVNAGIGFQLQDDLLDVYGDPAIFGKKVGGDIIQGKKTYLYLRALDLLSDEEKLNFVELYTSQGTSEMTKVSKVTEAFDQLYIRNYCEEAKQAFFDLALTHLKCVNVSESKKSELIDFSKSLLHRSK